MSELDQVLSWIREARPQRIVALTGAGMSAESGIPTFRGPGGLWEHHRPEDLATPEAFRRDPELVWRWYEWRREIIRKAAPNAGHLALARLERARELTVVTQNVDGLHHRAGSRNVIELHGNITRVRCEDEGTVTERPEPLESIHCTCGALLRPDVVWFGEPLPPGAMERAALEVSRADLVLVIGTSGVVYPAAGLVGLVREGLAVEINPDPTALSDACGYALGLPAGTALPPIVDRILETRP